MKFQMIGAGTLLRGIDGKHVAALADYQTQPRDMPPSLDNDWGAAR
jgi:hypothetical protein